MLKQKLQSAIATLNNRINRQVKAIYSQKELTNLITNWTNLALLVEKQGDNFTANIKVKLLDVKLIEVEKDIGAQLDIENSVLHNKLYEEELGQAGGEPFNLILGSYHFNINNARHIELLNRIVEIAHHAFALFISNLEINSEIQSQLENVLQEIFNPNNASAWHRLQTMPIAKFLALASCDAEIETKAYLSPYQSCFNKVNTYAATMLALRIMESFENTSWFSELPGQVAIAIDEHGQRVAPFLAIESKLNAQFFLHHDSEHILLNNGITPIIQNNTDSTPYIFSTSSAQIHDKLNLILEHVLCACRIAHHVKIMARQKIGSYATEHECENFIKQWLQKFTANIDDRKLRYRYPLNSFNVKLAKIPGKVGFYSCQIMLEPHMKLENLNSKIVLHSEIIATNR